MFKCLEKFFESQQSQHEKESRNESTSMPNIKLTLSKKDSIKEGIDRVFRLLNQASREEKEKVNGYKYHISIHLSICGLELTVNKMTIKIGVSIFDDIDELIWCNHELSVNEKNINLKDINDLDNNNYLFLKDLLNDTYNLVSKELKEIRKNSNIQKNKEISEINFFWKN